MCSPACPLSPLWSQRPPVLCSGRTGCRSSHFWPGLNKEVFPSLRHRPVQTYWSELSLRAEWCKRERDKNMLEIIPPLPPAPAGWPLHIRNVRPASIFCSDLNISQLWKHPSATSSSHPPMHELLNQFNRFFKISYGIKTTLKTLFIQRETLTQTTTLQLNYCFICAWEQIFLVILKIWP